MASDGESTAARKWTSIKYEMGQLIIIIHSKFAIRFVEALQHFARSDAYNLWHLHAEINLIKLLFCFFRTFFCLHSVAILFALCFISLPFQAFETYINFCLDGDRKSNYFFELSLKDHAMRFETLHISH